MEFTYGKLLEEKLSQTISRECDPVPVYGKVDSVIISDAELFEELMGSGDITNVEFYGTKDSGFNCMIYRSDGVIVNSEKVDDVFKSFSSAYSKLREIPRVSDGT